jgi:c-di-GMP-binding flagellar brake protein YcgR
MIQSENRRQYLRIDDKVSLYVHPLTAAEEESAIEHFELRRMDFSLMSHLMYGRDQHLPQMRIIEKKYPVIASYLKLLESQIETLSSRIVDSEHRLDPTQTTKVNISATGILINTDEAYPVDAMFELAIMLLPARTSFLVFGKVVRSDAIEDEAGRNQWQTAIEFTHLHEEDREVLIKHIHHLQLVKIQGRAEAAEAKE